MTLAIFSHKNLRISCKPCRLILPVATSYTKWMFKLFRIFRCHVLKYLYRKWRNKRLIKAGAIIQKFNLSPRAHIRRGKLILSFTICLEIYCLVDYEKVFVTFYHKGKSLWLKSEPQIKRKYVKLARYS